MPPEASGSAVGVAVTEAAARLAWLAASGSAVGIGTTKAGARLTTPQLVIPDDTTATPDVAGLSDLPVLEGDWTIIAADESVGQTHFGARWTGSEWEVGEEYAQGLVKSGSTSTYRIEITEEDKAEIRFVTPDDLIGAIRGTLSSLSLEAPRDDLETQSQVNLITSSTSASARVEVSPRLRLPEVSSSSTPAANHVYVYAKDKSGASALYAKDDAGTEHELTGAGGLSGVDFLVGTATGLLSGEIVAGTSPGGELGGTWASPTVDADHAGSAHRSMAVAVGAANVAASLTAANMVSVGQGGGTLAGRFVMPWAGAIVGISVSSNEARTAGSCTVEVYLNGSATGLTAVLNATNTTHKSTSQAASADTFSAGDYLEIKLTTTATWLPITADVIAQAWVQWTA